MLTKDLYPAQDSYPPNGKSGLKRIVSGSEGLRGCSTASFLAARGIEGWYYSKRK